MGGMIEVDFEKCKGCGLCVWVCPKGVLEMSSEKTNANGYAYAVSSDLGNCSGCTKCGVVCSDVCIRVYRDG